MFAVPAATPVTRPLADTVAIVGSADCHVADAVTFCDVPSERTAVAVNCDVPATAGAVPATVTELTVLGVVVDCPQALASRPVRNISGNVLIHRALIHPPETAAAPESRGGRQSLANLRCSPNGRSRVAYLRSM